MSVIVSVSGVCLDPVDIEVIGDQAAPRSSAANSASRMIDLDQSAIEEPPTTELEHQHRRKQQLPQISRVNFEDPHLIVQTIDGDRDWLYCVPAATPASTTANQQQQQGENTQTSFSFTFDPAAGSTPQHEQRHLSNDTESNISSIQLEFEPPASCAPASNLTSTVVDGLQPTAAAPSQTSSSSSISSATASAQSSAPIAAQHNISHAPSEPQALPVNDEPATCSEIVEPQQGRYTLRNEVRKPIRHQ